MNLILFRKKGHNNIKNADDSKLYRLAAWSRMEGYEEDVKGNPIYERQFVISCSRDGPKTFYR
jgi:hypothetical protein